MSQLVALAIVPKITSSIGCLSSIFIMSEILHDYRTNNMNPIKRALFGVTCFEICGSIGWFLSTWAIPKDMSGGFPFAVGTIASCNFQGFMLQLVVGAPMLNALLQYLVYLIVTRKCTVQKTRSIENISYITIVIFAVTAAIVPIPLQQYNPLGQMCWINGYPAGCSESIFGGSDVPCERGFYAQWTGIFLLFPIVWCSMLIIIYLNILIVRSLLNDGVSEREARWIGYQGLMYSGAFIITWTPSSVSLIVAYCGRFGFHFDILSVIFEPLQGFWNMLILLRSNPSSIGRLRSIFTCGNCFSLQQKKLDPQSTDPVVPVSNTSDISGTNTDVQDIKSIS
jgi:hypothetical protein